MQCFCQHLVRLTCNDILSFSPHALPIVGSNGIQGVGTVSLIATLYDSYELIADYMAFMEAAEGHGFILGSST